MVDEKNTPESLEFAESIINTVREPLISLDLDLRVVTANRSFYEFFKVKPEETVGQLIYDLGNKQWDIPRLRELLETILPQQTSFDGYEVEHNFVTIGRRTMLLNARQIQRVSGEEEIILLAIEDITENKKLVEALQESEEKYRTVADFTYNMETWRMPDGLFRYVSPSCERITGHTVAEFLADPHLLTKITHPDDQSKVIEHNRWPIKVLELKIWELIFASSLQAAISAGLGIPVLLCTVETGTLWAAARAITI